MENAQAIAPTAPEEQPEQMADDDMPTEPDRQREAFIKMRQELKEKNDLLKQYNTQDQTVSDELDVINQFRQGAYAPPQQTINQDTGIDEVMQRMSQAEQVAYQSHQRVSQLEQQLEDQKLFSEFPELNPKSEESKKPESRAFEEFVAGKAALEIMQGKRPDIVAIARKAKQSFSGMTSSQREAITEEVTKNIHTRENATLEARGTSYAPAVNDDDSALRRNVNRGDMDALSELFKKRG